MSRDLYNYFNYQELGQLCRSYSQLLDIFVLLISARFNDHSVLEVGAGAGCVAEYLLNNGCQVTALDPSPESMGATNARLIRSPFEKMRTNQVFDAIHEKDVVGAHITPHSFFSKSAEVLTEDGLVMTCALLPIADQLTETATSMGFDQINEFKWIPPDPQKDWYTVADKTRLVSIYQRS